MTPTLMLVRGRVAPPRTGTFPAPPERRAPRALPSPTKPNSINSRCTNFAQEVLSARTSQ